MEDMENKKLTPADVRKLCKAGNIVYIPHHECACCGRPVGWNLRWGNPVEVEFDPSCDCGSGGRTGQDWYTVADWVLNEDGTLREEYNWIADSVQSSDANSADAFDTSEAFKAGVEWQQCHKGCDRIEEGETLRATVPDNELELIKGWFEHIAQIADDRKTANGFVMEDWVALDEIKTLARNSVQYIENRLL